MKTATETLATILRTNADNCIRRARALGLTVECGRCHGTGAYSRNAYGSTVCYGCGGHKVVIAADAVVRAEALVASGAIDAYLAETESKRAAAAAKAAAARAEAAKREAEMAEYWRNCEALVARYEHALAAFRRDCANARALGLEDATLRAEGIAAAASRLTAPRVDREHALTRAVWAMETLHNDFQSYVLDHEPEVIAARRFAALCREADSYTTEVTVYA